MYHGANLPIVGEFANPTLLAELAVEAEHAGWDGVFVWDTLLFNVVIRGLDRASATAAGGAVCPFSCLSQNGLSGVCP